MSQNLKDVRKQIRQRRAAIAPDTQQRASQHIIQQIAQQSVFLTSQHIGLYRAQQGEVDPANLITHIVTQNKWCYLPVLHPEKYKSLIFYPYHPSEPLAIDRYGIEEPVITNKTPMIANTLDLLIMPMVLFDTACNRVGRGAGYYDRTLAFINEQPHERRPYLIGIAYEFQQYADIQPSSWDVPMDLVITEKQIYRRE